MQFRLILSTLARGICLLAVLSFLSAAGAAAEEEAESLPVYYKIGGLAVQYESKNCGYRTVVVEAQLELKDEGMVSRTTAFLPRIRADLYAALSSYLEKNKKINDRPVKQVIKNTANRVLGRGSVVDVLIMNVLYN